MHVVFVDSVLIWASTRGIHTIGAIDSYNTRDVFIPKMATDMDFIIP